MGMARSTFRNKKVAAQPGAPKPFNPGARKPLWDAAQWEAFRDGRELPTWAAGTHTHPDDLLSGPEAAEYLGIDYATLTHYQSEGRLTAVDVCGVPHYRRGDLEARRTTPGRAGRPPLTSA